MSWLAITHGAVRRAGRPVLSAASIRVALPASIAVVGANGSGKTSLFLLLAGALDRQRAIILIDGAPATIAYVPQEPALPPWLDGRRAAALYGLHGVAFDRLVTEMPALRLRELADLRVGSMSTGQRQALSIALALGRGADVTLLDEPFSALDFRRRVGALELLAEWRARHPGRALLVSSQNAADLLTLCDRFLVLRDGGLVFNGTRAELCAAGSGNRTGPGRSAAHAAGLAGSGAGPGAGHGVGLGARPGARPGADPGGAAAAALEAALLRLLG
jgi:ABC-2 type transport system ATP-binding protein